MTRAEKLATLARLLRPHFEDLWRPIPTHEADEPGEGLGHIRAVYRERGLYLLGVCQQRADSLAWESGTWHGFKLYLLSGGRLLKLAISGTWRWERGSTYGRRELTPCDAESPLSLLTFGEALDELEKHFPWVDIPPRQLAALRALRLP